MDSDVLETMEIRIRNHREFLRETNLPGVVFRGQTRDYGSLTPALYRQDLKLNLDALEQLASRCYLEIHDRVHELKHRAALYEDGLERARWPDFSWLNWYGDADNEPLMSVRFVPPFYRTVLAWKALTDPDAEWELAELEAEDDRLNWEKFEEEAKFVQLYQERAYVLARLQHYGIPTPALDVTFDPYVALWFATHRLVLNSNRTGYYEKSDQEGVVYVLSALNHEIGDLRREHVIPLAGLRAYRQKGAVFLGATKTEPDLSRHVVKKLFVTADLLRPPIWRLRQRRRVRHLYQDYLFPGSSEDHFYGFLLQAKVGRGNGELAKWVVEYVQPSININRTI